MTRINGIRSQIENLKYDRDLLIQESKTFYGLFKRWSISNRVKKIESQILQLQRQLDLVNQNQITFDNSLVKLHQRIAKYFDGKEIRGLCFELGIDYDEVVREGKSDTIRELILYLERRQRTPELITLCKKSRPKMEWQ